MPPSDVALAHRRRVSQIGAATLAAARRQWMALGGGDWDVAWRTVGPRLVALLVASQIAVGRESSAYVSQVVDGLGLNAPAVAQPSPSGLAGTASDGRPLDSLLYTAVTGTRMLTFDKSLSTEEALQLGQSILDRIVTTQVSDASRTADSVAMTARPAIQGMRRIAFAPCCARCAVLSGRFYRWSTGFQRHPGCDCGMEPATEGDAESSRALFESGQVRGLSNADAKAIADGADPSQVVNAHRGMSVAGGLKVTSEGTTRRGGAYKLMVQRHGAARAAAAERDQVNRLIRNERHRAKRAGVEPDYSGLSFQLRRHMPNRLMPEAIYQVAEDRADALRLLRTYGYII